MVSTEEETLSSLVRKLPKKRVIAPNGTDSHQKYILGPPGESVKLEVPVGITVLRDDGRVIGIQDARFFRAQLLRSRLS